MHGHAGTAPHSPPCRCVEKQQDKRTLECPFSQHWLSSGPEEPPALSSVVCGSQRMQMGIKCSLLAPSNGFIAENSWLSQGTAQHHGFFSLFSGLFPPSCLLACGTRIYVRKVRCVNCFPFRAACLYWDAFVTLDSWETLCPFLALFSISVSSSSLTLFSLYFPPPLFFFFTSPSFLYPRSSFFSSLTWFRVRRAHAKRIAMCKS